MSCFRWLLGIIPRSLPFLAHPPSRLLRNGASSPLIIQVFDVADKIADNFYLDPRP